MTGRAGAGFFEPDVFVIEPGPHREPGGSAYASVERFKPGDLLTPSIDIAPLDVAALLAR